MQIVVLLMVAHVHTWFALTYVHIRTFVAGNTVCPHVACLCIQILGLVQSVWPAIIFHHWAYTVSRNQTSDTQDYLNTEKGAVIPEHLVSAG